MDMASNHWLQAGRIGFAALAVFTVLTAVRWLGSNVRQVDAGERAVVMHLGALAREQSAGLLWAWPAPIDEVVLVPAAEAVLERHVQALLRSRQALDADAMAYDDDEGGPVSDALAGSGYLLTGDAGIIQLDVRVFYQVTDAPAYVLQRGHAFDGGHVLAALDRLVTRSALLVTAGRDLDTILVARPELLDRGGLDAEQRERLRSDLLARINGALDDLRGRGLNLGVRARRVDVQSALPRDTLNAFNGVLTASQQAEQAVADARTDAARILQQATQAADRSLQVANASASERVGAAQAATANVLHLAASLRTGAEPGLLLRVYRERLPGILQQAGTVTAVEPARPVQLFLPGADP